MPDSDFLRSVPACWHHFLFVIGSVTNSWFHVERMILPKTSKAIFSCSLRHVNWLLASIRSHPIYRSGRFVCDDASEAKRLRLKATIWWVKLLLLLLIDNRLAWNRSILFQPWSRRREEKPPGKKGLQSCAKQPTEVTATTKNYSWSWNLREVLEILEIRGSHIWQGHINHSQIKTSHPQHTFVASIQHHEALFVSY
jgi:hypothetical protein